VTFNVKGQIERKFFSKSKNLPNFDLLWGLEIRWYEKERFLLQKAHPYVKTRRFSHFAWMFVEGSDPRAERGKIVRKSPTPIGMICRR